MSREPVQVDWHFPKAGIDVSRPANSWPLRMGPNNEKHYSCADALNVRGYDSITKRQRGGTRPGFSRYIDDLVGSVTYIIQELNCLTINPSSVSQSGSGGILIPISPTGGAVQPSQSGRVITIVSVCQGFIRVASPGDTTWTAPTNNASNSPPLNASGIMFSAPNLQDLWFADGTDDFVYYDPDGNTIEDWVLTAGTHPEFNNNGPRLICLWRGRTIRSGIIGDPQNIFASKIGDPFDYDYNPANPSASQAWALNLADMGVIGDVVNGLIPSTDDVLVVLCDHSIYKITGDPADGGEKDLICEGIGGAWGQAWCVDPNGNIYFFSNIPGVYIMPPKGSGAPVRISNPIDPLLRDVNTGTNTIRLFWDDLAQGVWVFISPTAEEADDPDDVTCWFYEAPRPDGSGNAWWKVRFANPAHNPLTGCIVDGNEPGDRALIVGSWDGYVRQPDPDALDDDGTPINSYVIYGPFCTPNMDEVKLDSMQGSFGEGSADVDYEVLLGKTPELALADTTATVEPRIGTFGENRGYTKRVNRAAYAIYLKLSSIGRWAAESIRVTLGRTLSMKRRRGNR